MSNNLKTCIEYTKIGQKRTDSGPDIHFVSECRAKENDKLLEADIYVAYKNNSY